MMRVAIVANREMDLARVERFLPSNYAARVLDNGSVEVFGEDSAGWTLDGYVIPRLASGMIFAQEVTP